MQSNIVIFYKTTIFNFSNLVDHGFYILLAILHKPDKLKY
jgi:hypothetical protein